MSSESGEWKANKGSFLLPDYPETVRWLSEEERALAVDRLRLEGSHGDGDSLSWATAKETLTDWRLYAHYAASVHCLQPEAITNINKIYLVSQFRSRLFLSSHHPLPLVLDTRTSRLN